MATIPENFEPLFTDEAYGVLATMTLNGNPHLTVVWVDYDGEFVLINTARGRRKTKNMEQDPTVALLVIDPNDPFRYISLLGEVETITQERAVEHIDALGKRYKGVDDWSERYDEDVVRVIVKIAPKSVFTREPYGIEK